jgi:hypothetical protein
MYRIGCWLEAPGVGYGMRPVIEGCLMHEKGICEGETVKTIALIGCKKRRYFFEE